MMQAAIVEKVKMMNCHVPCAMEKEQEIVSDEAR